MEHLSDKIDQSGMVPEDPEEGISRSPGGGIFSLFLGDLSYFCTENDLQQMFGHYRDIVDIRIIRNKATKKSLSYGFIDFSNANSAAQAMQEMNGQIICGRTVK